MEISQQDLHQILKIVDETENLAEVQITLGDLRLHVRRFAQPDERREAMTQSVAEVPMTRRPPRGGESAAAATPPAPPTKLEVPPGMHGIRAPMLGTFYRAPSPGEKPFVEVGQRVKADDTIAVIEVMKLFNSISAGVDGVVDRIVANDATLVEYGEVLVLVKAD